MRKYIRPHVETILPGPQGPKYTYEQDPARGGGSYWAEFTFQPSPILQSNFKNEELRSGFIVGLHLAISGLLPDGIDLKHVFTTKEENNNFEYFIYCNKHGRLSHVNSCSLPKGMSY